jgi:splicing factor 3A subunit 3
MFTGEEAYGKYLDLTTLHEDYLNLKGVKRITYLQYLDSFYIFTPPHNPITRSQKASDQYFGYVGRLAAYLEDFLKRTKPLQDLDAIFSRISEEFEKDWTDGIVPGWIAEVKPAGPAAPKAGGDAIWCEDCEKEFGNENVYKGHLTGKKHIKAAAARATRALNGEATVLGAPDLASLKERAIAEREYRTRKLANILKEERTNTRANVERKQGMTERERQQELEQIFAETSALQRSGGKEDDDSDSDDEKLYNPLKLPLAWDGKPIPYWLYKLHGLGVEIPCEICGNFVYMGRRAFDKHFNEARHIYGLKCLGITNTTLFREITGIEDAQKLWNKVQGDKKKEKTTVDNVVQMEDADGNVMPEKVYYDLQKQGLL